MNTIVRNLSLVVPAMLLGAALAPAAEFHHDFRGTDTLPPGLNPFGKDSRQFVTLDKDGLRIRLPADRKHLVPTGVELAFPVSGDFEITLSYEVLQIDAPQNAYGAGLNLFLRARSAAQDDAILGRFRKPDKGEVYAITRVSTDAQGKPRARYFATPADTQKGKLRVVRKGSNLTFLVANEEKPFREIATRDYSAEDLELVRIAANTGKEPRTIDVRILDFDVRAESFESRTPAPVRPAPARAAAAVPGAPPGQEGNPAAVAPEANARPRGGLFLTVLVALVLIAGFFLVALGIRNRRKEAAAGG